MVTAIVVRIVPAFILPLVLMLTSPAALAGSAKILLYHHVAEDTPPATSVTPERFEAHLALIESQGYRVVALSTIVNALRGGEPLDSRWVAITFDDAYESVLTQAAPRLAERGWSFTVFASTDAVDGGHEPYLDWDGLRTLAGRGATIANHGRRHEHLIRRRQDEPPGSWHERITNDVLGAQTRLEEEIDDPPRLFAYPYGEFDEAVAGIVRSLGFTAFGQQSGPVGHTTSPQAIPRFPLATGFDSVDALAEKLRTEHLALADAPVPATVLGPDPETPILTLRLDGRAIRPGSLNCFVDGQPGAEVRWITDVVAEVRADAPLDPGRSKYTCTAPHPGIPGAYYWHTHLYMKPRPDGSWYEG